LKSNLHPFQQKVADSLVKLIMKTKITSTFAAQLLAERKRLRLTQPELSKVLGVSPSTIWKWENGAEESAEITQEGALARLRAMKPQVTMRLIFAGTHEQAALFAIRRGWPADEWRYVRDVAQFLGIRNAEFYTVGSWMNRPGFSEILSAAQQRAATGELKIIES
jgi:transcriptional regulator with XRE-family HTH domain